MQKKLLKRLPLSIQKQAIKTYRLWKKEPYHNSLHFKKVSQSQPIYSVRITISYRALGLLEQDRVYWFWIGKHDKYDELLQRL